MSEYSYNHLMPDDPPQKPVGWEPTDAQAIFNAWFQGVENADTYIPIDAQDSLVAAFSLALTAQAQGHVKQETHNAAVRTIATQAGEIERLRSEAGYVAAADVIAHLTAQRDSIERATWAAALDLMAAMEADIAAEPRHSVGEVRGAHMLGATIRARAAAGPSVFVEPFDAQGTP